MIFAPQGQDFQWSFSNVTATRPVTTGRGSVITPGTAPTFGAWVEVASAANMTQETYGILLCFNNGATAAAIRNILVNIGVDNAGGTAYEVRIPTLIAGSASTFGLGGGGIWYYFPLYIPAGSSVAVQATGTLTTAFNAYVQFFGQPRRPETLRVGSYVTSFGIDLANARGTAVTLGTTAEGAYTQLGATTTRSHWWWQSCYYAADTTMALQVIFSDLAAGNATVKKILYENQYTSVTAAEQIANMPVFVNAYNNVAVGENIYIRGQTSGTPDTGTGFAAYGLGG